MLTQTESQMSNLKLITGDSLAKIIDFQISSLLKSSAPQFSIKADFYLQKFLQKNIKY